MSDRVLRHSESSPAELYLAPQGAADEAHRAIDISVIGAAGAGAATFCPQLPPVASSADGGKATTEPDAEAGGERGVALSEAWCDWLEQRFERILGKSFNRVHGAAGNMRIGEILRADQAIDEALDEGERKRSLAAAQVFLEGREKVRHMPQLVRLAAAIERAEAPGHVTTLFAMQASLYHLPRLAGLVSYAYFEWLGGAVAAGWRGPMSVAFFETAYPQTFDSVRRILHGEKSGEKSGGEAGQGSIFSVE